jgi:hypothetical protein
MNNLEEKATSFISRLIANPALKALTPLQKEEQILQFLQANARQLYPTLTAPALFPGMNWEQIARLLIEALEAEVDRDIAPRLSTVVRDNLDLSFIQLIRQQNMPQERIKEHLESFFTGLLRSRDFRRDFAGAMNAVAYGYVNRYLEHSFARREYVHFELTKVQKLRMGKEEVKHFVHLSILLKPAIHVIAHSQGGELGTATVQTQFMEKAVDLLSRQLPELPEEVVKSGVFANGSFIENRSLDATSRLAGVFTALGRNSRGAQKLDRGAVSADKSRLSIARRNFKFNGFDIKMLDELYKIAGENGW